MRTGIYWEKGLQTPAPAECELIELDAQAIPALMSAIAGRMGRSHWESEAAYLEGYSRLSWQGAQLLMGCKEDLIREIRDARGSTPPGLPTDLESYPVGTFPGGSLATVERLLYAAPSSTAELLTEIRDLLIANGEGSEAQLEALATIITLL